MYQNQGLFPQMSSGQEEASVLQNTKVDWSTWAWLKETLYLPLKITVAIPVPEGKACTFLEVSPQRTQ